MKQQLTNIKNLFVISFFSSIFIGIIVFSSYFIKIQYFPINLSSIIYLPVIVGLTTFTLIASIAGISSISVCFWAELLKSKDTCCWIVGLYNTESVIQDYKNSSIDINIKSRLRIFLWYNGLTFLCSFLWFAAYQTNTTMIIVLLLLGFIGKYWVLFTQENKDSSVLTNIPKSHIKKKRTTLAKIFSFSLFTTLLLSISYAALVTLLELQDTSDFVYVAILFVFCSSFCLIPYRKGLSLLKWAVLSTTISIVFSIVIYGKITSISSKIIYLFKFGQIEKGSIIVDEIGCNIFKINGFEIICPANQKLYSIHDTSILWRAGEYFIQHTVNPKLKFILAEKHVLSISFNNKNEPN